MVEQAPDAVVLATGAVPYRPSFEFSDEADVLEAWDVIHGQVPPPGAVLVADWRGDWAGVGTALLLAQSGRKVTLATVGYQAGETLQQYTRDELLKQLFRAKVNIVPLARLFGSDEDTVYLQHVLTGDPIILDGFGSVVLAQGHAPVTSLADELAALPTHDRPEVHLVGDCLSPRSAEEAILEGMRAAYDL